MNYILGCDRSHLNDPVALQSLVDKGIKFIFFKATQGLTYIDPTFNSAWQQAKATQGLIRGAYHFFNPQVDGIEQAKHFLSLGINFKGVGCLPPWVDVEDLVGSNEAETTALNQWVANNWKLAVERLNDFLGYVQSTTGKVCGIYTYNGYMKEYFHGTQFPNNPFWLSSLQANCPPRYDTDELPIFWQNTYRWQNTDMDGDFFTGTQEELNSLANIV